MAPHMLFLNFPGCVCLHVSGFPASTSIPELILAFQRYHPGAFYAHIFPGSRPTGFVVIRSFDSPEAVLNSLQSVYHSEQRLNVNLCTSYTGIKKRKPALQSPLAPKLATQPSDTGIAGAAPQGSASSEIAASTQEIKGKPALEPSPWAPKPATLPPDTGIAGATPQGSTSSEIAASAQEHGKVNLYNHKDKSYGLEAKDPLQSPSSVSGSKNGLLSKPSDTEIPRASVPQGSASSEIAQGVQSEWESISSEIHKKLIEGPMHWETLKKEEGSVFHVLISYDPVMFTIPLAYVYPAILQARLEAIAGWAAVTLHHDSQDQLIGTAIAGPYTLQEALSVIRASNGRWIHDIGCRLQLRLITPVTFRSGAGPSTHHLDEDGVHV